MGVYFSFVLASYRFCIVYIVCTFAATEYINPPIELKFGNNLHSRCSFLGINKFKIGNWPCLLLKMQLCIILAMLRNQSEIHGLQSSSHKTIQSVLWTALLNLFSHKLLLEIYFSSLKLATHIPVIFFAIKSSHCVSTKCYRLLWPTANLFNITLIVTVIKFNNVFMLQFNSTGHFFKTKQIEIIEILGNLRRISIKWNII